NCVGMLPPLAKAELRTWACASREAGSARLNSKVLIRIVSVFIGVRSFLAISPEKNKRRAWLGGVNDEFPMTNLRVTNSEERLFVIEEFLRHWSLVICHLPC